MTIPSGHVQVKSPKLLDSAQLESEHLDDHLEPRRQISQPEPQAAVEPYKDDLKLAIKENAREMVGKGKEAALASIKNSSGNESNQGSVKGGGLARKGQGAATAHGANTKVLTPKTH